jgi:hypothetical protein
VSQWPAVRRAVAARTELVALRRRHVTIAAAFAAASIALVPAVAGAATTQSEMAKPTVLTGTKVVPGVLLGLSKAHKDGAAPAGRVMTIGIGVAAPHLAAEKALETAMYDPKSPDYHRFLTPTEFDSMFGVSQANTSALTAWLKDDGLHVQSVSDDGQYVMAAGTVAQLDKRFQVTIGAYTDTQDKKVAHFLANDVAPTVPASLPITAVSGLDTVQHVTTAVDASGQKPKLLGPAGSYEGTLTPENLWGVYDEPTTDEGEGQTIGIFGEGETDSVVTQLRLFEHHFLLPKIPVKTVFTEPGQASTGGDNTGSIEWYLDAQASTGMAPKAKQLQFWFSNTLYDPDIAASISKWVDTPSCTSSSSLTATCAPVQMNASFGECETGVGNGLTGILSQLPYGTELGDDLEPIAEPLLLKATMLGRTLFASAGDTGSGCPEVVVPVAGAANGLAPQPVPVVNYPCASDYAVCVGGTVLDTDDTTHNTRVDEVSWMDTGGGASHYLLQPSFQKGILTTVEQAEAPCVINSSGNAYPEGSTCRTVPDVAALSGNAIDNDYFIYIDGAPSSEGGTSLSSPLTMGMWARLQAAAPTQAGLGFADETYYAQGKSAEAYGTGTTVGDFYDITGNEPENTTGVPSTNGVYMAGPGYDLTSGLGVPDIGHLLRDVDHRETADLAQTAVEKPDLIESTVTDTSPDGNAADPLVVNPVRGLPAIGPVGDTITEQPAVDLTKATLTTSKDGKTVTATMYGPELSSTPDTVSAATGENFVMYWYDPVKKDVYYLEAATSATGAPTYTAGDTNGGFAAITTVTVTGSFTGHTLTMSAPLAGLGNPAKGAVLADPAANTQSGALSSVTDTASFLSPATASVGQDVCVGGCATTTNGVVTPVSATKPTTTTTASKTTTGELAFTGLDVLVPITALVLVGAGGTALALTRRRRREL